MRMMFYVGGTTVYGMETSYLTLLPELQRLGHEVCAIVSGWNDGNMPQMLRRRGVRFHEIKLGKLYVTQPSWTLDTLAHLPGACLELSRRARDFRPDVVVHSCSDIAEIAGRLTRNAKHVFHLHNLPTERPIRARWSWVRRKTDLFLCISQFTDDALGRLGVPPERRAIALYGVPAPGAEPSAGRGDGGRMGRVRISVIGQLIPRKDQITVLQALALMDPGSRRDVEVSFFGTGMPSYATQLESLANRESLDDVVRWRGYESRQAELYDCDIVVSASIDEAFGLTLVEAAAWGLPVVAAACGGHLEIVRDGVTGLLFEPRSAAALARALTRLVRDPASRRKMGAAAMDHYARTFTPAAFAHRFIDAIALEPSAPAP